jgi:acylphosphatase
MVGRKFVTNRHRVRLRISGSVQGVGYRYSALAEARRLHLSGFVRNEPDSTVTAEVEGTEEAVSTFVRWARRGPVGASVAGVDVEPLPPGGDSGSGFAITG